MYGNGSSFRIDELVKLNEDPRWEGVALLTAASLREAGKDKKDCRRVLEVAREAREKWPASSLIDSILVRTRNADPDRLRKYLGSRLDEIVKNGFVATTDRVH